MYAHQVSEMICRARTPKSQIMGSIFLGGIITLSNEVVRDSKSNMRVKIRMLCNTTCETGECDGIAM